MEWIAVQKHDLQVGEALFDEEPPQPQWVGQGQVFIRVTEAAVNLQRHAERAALLRRPQEQCMTERFTLESNRFACAGARPKNPEVRRSAARIGFPQLEAGPVGGDRLDANSATGDR